MLPGGAKLQWQHRATIKLAPLIRWLEGETVATTTNRSYFIMTHKSAQCLGVM